MGLCTHLDAFFTGLVGVLKMLMGCYLHFKSRTKESLAWNVEITFFLENLK